jgi:putative ABC transport system permease protein
LSDALAAVMPLNALQHLAQLQGKITRVLVQVLPGRERQVERELRVLAAGRLTVAPARQDISVLREALRPSDQASAFFAGVVALLGFLFAFTATLLTVPERRRAIADLRLVGTSRRAITQMVMFQALCLGVAASVIGVIAGYALSRWALHQSTAYLAEAFALGTSTVLSIKSLVLPLLGGVLAACLASTLPLLDLRRDRRVDAVYSERGIPGNDLSLRTHLALALLAVFLVALQVGVVAQWPSLALPASVLIAIATVLVVPLVLTAVLGMARALAERAQSWSVLPIALASLRATTLRSLVLAATGAVAIFGSVALGGARADLLRGIHRYSHNYTVAEQVWIGSPNNNQATVAFPPDGLARRIERVEGVASVSAFQGGFLDIGNRRVWVIAWPASSRFNLLDGQVLSGTAGSTAQRLRDGGWLTASKQLLSNRGLSPGGTLSLPVPTGTARLRIAATTTNFGWPPGAILMSTADFTRAWGTTAITGLGVRLAAGADASALQRRIARALGPSSGLEVLTAAQRESRINTSASEGLGRLGEISNALIIAAVLAMASTLGSSIWQRRTALAGLRLSGVKPARLRRVLLLECALMLVAGCLTGAVAGVYGEFVFDKYLRDVTGFPLAGVRISGQPLEVLALVLVGALLIVSVPGWLASRVSPNLALEGEQ